MPDLNVRRCVVWSVVFGLVSYVAYFQLQETTATITQFVIVPAKRRDISEQFFERPQIFSDFHPYGIGISNVGRTMSEEDPQQIKELRFVLRQRMPSPFGFEFEVEFKHEFVELDALVKTSARLTGLIEIKVNATFLLADYKSKEESGTMLIESRSYTGPRVVVTQVFPVVGPAVQRKLHDNLRQFFL